MRFVGEGFVIDTTAFTVERDGQPVDLEPQAMDLLIHLVEHRGEMRTKADLIDAVWHDSFVSEAALTTRIKQIRKAVGDDGKAQRFIRTVHGRGYLFTGEIEVVDGEVSDDVRPAPAAARHNLPAARVNLIGRTELCGQVVDALDSHRLVTLVGFGGAGKTSVALAAGRRLIAGGLSDVWLADLVPARASEDIDQIVARAVGLQLASPDNRSTLLAALAARELTLILDNCEHVLAHVSAFVDAVLDGAPGVRILATSREVLRVAGERRLAVEPLPVIDDAGGAVDLLQAVADRCGATISPQERVPAFELCRRLDGLPLAIELVGARLATHSVPELLDRLDRAVVDDGTVGEHPDRHASLARILTDTVDDLDEAATELLTVASMISGPFGVDDVERLWSGDDGRDPLRSFHVLLDRSLISVDPGPPRRFRVLEPVRQHMSAVDADPSRTAQAHAFWVQRRLGSSFRPHFHDLGLFAWVAERFVDVETAVTVAIDAGDHEMAANMASATALAMHLDDGSRAGRMLKLVDQLAAVVEDPALLARLHCAGVMTAQGAREPMGIYEHGVAAVLAAGSTDDKALQALARIMRSWAGVVLDADQALRDVDEAIALATEAGDSGTALMATGYKVCHLVFSLRFAEATEVGFAAYSTGADAMSYPMRVVGTGLMGCLVFDDPETMLRVDAEIREGITNASFWGTVILRAAAQASLGRLDEALESVDVLLARLDQAGIDPVPDILLTAVAFARRAGESERAARYLGAVRASPRQTQNLVVSMAYRAMRSHIDGLPAAEIGATTHEVWAEAYEWMTSHSGGVSAESP